MNKNIFNKIKFLVCSLLTIGTVVSTTIPAYAMLSAQAEQKNNEINIIWYYNIAFDKNDPKATGTMDPILKVAPSQQVPLPENKFENPGYIFEGWALTPTGDPTIKDKDTVNKDTFGVKEHDKTVYLYAKWKPVEYTVTYKQNKPATATNEVLGTTPDSKHKFDEAKNLTKNGYTLKGWTFEGWNSKPDGTGTPYTDEQSVINLTTIPDDVVPMYAQWKPIGYTVTYKQNKPADAESDVAGTTPDSKHEFDVAKNLTKNGYTLDGWKFLGWNSKPDGTGTPYTDEQSVINLTDKPNDVVPVYAQWEPDVWHVIYDANTGTGTMEGQTMKWNDKTTKVSPNGFTKAGFTFLGWSLDPQGEVEFNSGSIHLTNLKDGKQRYGANPGDTITLYAIWDPTTLKDGYYKISGSSADGGDSKFFHSETVTGQTTTIVDNTKPGTKGETFTGIYYIDDDVEFNKQVDAGAVGNDFKYPESN